MLKQRFAGARGHRSQARGQDLKANKVLIAKDGVHELNSKPHQHVCRPVSSHSKGANPP